MPAEVKLADVGDGASLGADVLDARGNVLLAAGTRLTRAHLSLLERRGIESVTVVLPEEFEGARAGSGEVVAAELARALERQERAFAKVRGRPLMETIYRAARAHLEAGNLPQG